VKPAPLTRLLAAPLLALVLAALPAVVSARPTPLRPATKRAKLRSPPSCIVFGAAIAALELGALKGPGVTTLPDSHTICSWSAERQGHYTSIATVQITAAPSFLGRDLLGLAKSSARAAARKPGGAGEVLTTKPKLGLYYEGLAAWSEQQPDRETGKCRPVLNAEGFEIGQNSAIEPGQGGPTCAGQPGTEGDFATAYGSPHPNIKPTLIQIQVAAEANTTSQYELARIEANFFRTGH